MSQLVVPASSHTAVVTGWTNPSNAFATVADSVYATAAPAKNQTVSGDYGFTITGVPAGATINSVVATVSWKVSTTTGATLGAQIWDNGVAQGTETTFSSTTQTVSTQTVSSGITQADLAGGLVKVRVRDTRANTTTSHTGSVDFVSLTIDYTANTTFTDRQPGYAAATGSLAESQAATTSYTDSPVGLAAAAGTLTQSYTHSSLPVGAETATGSVAQSLVYADTWTGTATASGTIVQTLTYADARPGLAASAGSVTEASLRSVTPTGTESATGSVTESHTTAGIFSDSPAGSAAATGSRAESSLRTVAPTGTATATGTRTESSARSATPSGAATPSGTRTEASLRAVTPTGVGSASGTVTENWSQGNAHPQSISPFLLERHTGINRVHAIEEWLDANLPEFLDYRLTGLSRINNIEQTLIDHPLSGTKFCPYEYAGTDRIWAIESYLLAVSGSDG